MNESIGDRVPVLRLVGLERSYPSGGGQIHVLRGADLDLRPGEVVGLVGPSGSGKSSLLHAAGLLERPNAGEVWIDGVETLALPERDRTLVRRDMLGFVYQFHHLLPEFNAIENVAMPLLIAGEPKARAHKVARRLLGLMGLAGRETHRPSELSGGEQQRVAIARAVANKPRVLLADEPTGNLDPTTSGSVFQSLFDLARIEHVAVLVATHNLDLTAFMDRVVTLKQGKVVPR